MDKKVSRGAAVQVVQPLFYLKIFFDSFYRSCDEPDRGDLLRKERNNGRKGCVYV